MPELEIAETHRGSLDHLLAPVPRERFRAEHWGRRHLVVQGRERDHYGDVFRFADVDRYLAIAARSVEASISIGRAGHGLRVVPVRDLEPRQLYAAVGEGNSLMIPGIQRFWPAAEKLARRLGHDLSAQVKINAYVTPAGHQGAPVHPDVQDVFVLQLEGRKDWTIYDGFGYDPVSSLDYGFVLPRASPPEAEVAETFQLAPGDLLYIPRGLLHRAAAPDDAPSLHLAVCATPIYWVDVLAAALELASTEAPELSRPVGFGFPSDAAARDEAGERFAALVERFAAVADFPRTVDLLEKAAAVRSRLPPDGHLEQLLRLDALSLDSRVELRTGLRSSLEIEGEAAVLRFGSSQVRLPSPLAPVLTWIRQGESFAVRDLPDTIADEGKIKLVQRLIREGFLRVDADPSHDARRGAAKG